MNYLKQYEYIAAISDYKSITIAAERLGIAQSALSRYVKKLEQSLGVQLFSRTSEPITLTEAGHCFLETGRKMLALDQAMKLRIREIQMPEHSYIRIGIGITRGPYILPVILKQFRKQDDRTNILIFELTTEEIKRRLLKNELDIAISVFDTDSSRIQYVDLFKERILLCENSAAACNCPIYPGAGQFLRGIMDAIVADGIDDSKCYLEAQNTETAVAMVKAGLGFTVVPSYFEEFAFGDGLKYSELQNASASYERLVCLLYRNDKTLRKEERLFMQCAIETLSE